MSRQTFRIVSSLSFVLLSILLAASPALAAAEVLEVQVVPPEDPEFLVIYGQAPSRSLMFQSRSMTSSPKTVP